MRSPVSACEGYAARRCSWGACGPCWPWRGRWTVWMSRAGLRSGKGGHRARARRVPAGLSPAPGRRTSSWGVRQPEASPAKGHGRFGLLFPPGTQTRTSRALQGPTTWGTLRSSGRDRPRRDVGAPPTGAGAGFRGPRCVAPVRSCLQPCRRGLPRGAGARMGCRCVSLSRER